MSDTIINNESSFKQTLNFCQKYFDNVVSIKNKNSKLAKCSQNFFKIILFENRGQTFSIKWNYNHCILHFGDISKNKKTSLQYTFTKMSLDNCYPIEEGNNYNVVFWEYQITYPNDDMPQQISPLRMPISKNVTAPLPDC
jgi:hypothetical protein